MTTEDFEAEYQRCMDPLYFYNTYWLKPGDKKMTRQEWDSTIKLVSNIKYRKATLDSYDGTPNTDFKNGMTNWIERTGNPDDKYYAYSKRRSTATLHAQVLNLNHALNLNGNVSIICKTENDYLTKVVELLFTQFNTQVETKRLTNEHGFIGWELIKKPKVETPG